MALLNFGMMPCNQYTFNELTDIYLVYGQSKCTEKFYYFKKILYELPLLFNPV